MSTQPPPPMWEDLYDAFTACSARVVKDTIDEVTIGVDSVLDTGKMALFALLTTSGLQPENLASRLLRTSLGTQLHERGNDRLRAFLEHIQRETKSTDTDAFYVLEKIVVSTRPKRLVAPVRVTDSVEGSVFRLFRVWPVEDLYFYSDSIHSVGFPRLDAAIDRASAYCVDDDIAAQLEVRLHPTSSQGLSPASWWQRREHTTIGQPDLVWALDRYLERVEGSIWDQQERLLDDLWARGAGIKVGITNAPSIRARSEMYQGFETMFIIGESSNSSRVSACEANLVRYLWRRHGKNHPRCLNNRPGGSEPRPGDEHFVYIALKS